MTDFDDVSGACEAIAIEVQGTVMQTSDALYDLARAVCDRYWAKFQMKNRSQAHLPEDKRQLGRFAPCVGTQQMGKFTFVGGIITRVGLALGGKRFLVWTYPH